MKKKNWNVLEVSIVLAIIYSLFMLLTNVGCEPKKPAITYEDAAKQCISVCRNGVKKFSIDYRGPECECLDAAK